MKGKVMRLGMVAGGTVLVLAFVAALGLAQTHLLYKCAEVNSFPYFRGFATVQTQMCRPLWPFGIQTVESFDIIRWIGRPNSDLDSAGDMKTTQVVTRDFYFWQSKE